LASGLDEQECGQADGRDHIICAAERRPPFRSTGRGQVGVTDEIENAVKKEAGDHNPEALEETHSGHGCENREECYLGDESLRARHDSEQRIERADNGQNNRIERPIAIVPDNVGEERNHRSKQRSHD